MQATRRGAQGRRGSVHGQAASQRPKARSAPHASTLACQPQPLGRDRVDEVLPVQLGRPQARSRYQAKAGPRTPLAGSCFASPVDTPPCLLCSCSESTKKYWCASATRALQSKLRSAGLSWSAGCAGPTSALVTHRHWQKSRNERRTSARCQRYSLNKRSAQADWSSSCDAASRGRRERRGTSDLWRDSLRGRRERAAAYAERRLGRLSARETTRLQRRASRAPLVLVEIPCRTVAVNSRYGSYEADGA